MLYNRKKKIKKNIIKNENYYQRKYLVAYYLFPDNPVSGYKQQPLKKKPAANEGQRWRDETMKDVTFF